MWYFHVIVACVVVVQLFILTLDRRCCLLTDGVSTTDNQYTIPYARVAKRRGIKMIAIGVTEDSDTEELMGIASDAS